MATSTPLISIVMPNYNNEKFLPDTIRSIQKQSFSDYELVIYHDKSQDNSLQVLQQFSDKDKRINLIEGIEKKGCAHGYNMAITNATGKYIFVMDADNIMAPELLQKSLDFMDAHPEITMLSSIHKTIGNYEKIIKQPAGHDLIALKLLNGCYFSNSMMVRRELFDKTGLRYDENLSIAGDYKLFLDAMLQNEYPVKFAIMDYLGIYYRIHDDNVSINTGSDHKQIKDRLAIGEYVSGKLYPQDDKYKILHNILQFNMNANFIKKHNTINTDYITLKNLLLWRDATMHGLRQYQKLNDGLMQAYFNKKIISMIFKKFKASFT